VALKDGIHGDPTVEELYQRITQRTD